MLETVLAADAKKSGNSEVAKVSLPDTGAFNPVLEVITLPNIALLVYDAISPFTTASQREGFVYSGIYPGIMGSQPFDELTAEFRRKMDEDVYRGEVFPPEVEIDDRRSFLKHPYMIGVSGSGVVGGAWQHHVTGSMLSRHRRVMACHIGVFEQFRGTGYGGLLLETFVNRLVAPKYDGVRFSWDDNPGHEGSPGFFKGHGFAVTYFSSSRTYSAEKLFTAPATPRQGQARTA